MRLIMIDWSTLRYWSSSWSQNNSIMMAPHIWTADDRSIPPAGSTSDRVDYFVEEMDGRVHSACQWQKIMVLFFFFFFILQFRNAHQRIGIALLYMYAWCKLVRAFVGSVWMLVSLISSWAHLGIWIFSCQNDYTEVVLVINFCIWKLGASVYQWKCINDSWIGCWNHGHCSRYIVSLTK